MLHKSLPKSAGVAAVLNFFIWGLGYLYLGKRTTFGVILAIGSIISLLSVAFPSGGSLGYDTVQALGLLVVSLAFAWDASQLAKEDMATSSTRSV